MLAGPPRKVPLPALISAFSFQRFSLSVRSLASAAAQMPRLRTPDPWKLGESAGDPSPALAGTLSPFEG